MSKNPEFSSVARAFERFCALNTETLVTPQDLEKIGIASVATLTTWRSRHLGPVSIAVAGGPRYRVRDVRAWLDAGGTRGALHRHPEAAA